MSRKEALAVLSLDDGRIFELLEATFRVRKAFHGKKVKLCVLQNARSGLCSEDCGYCSQSRISKAKIDRYPMVSVEELVEGAKRAYQAGAKRYCMVTSAKSPTKKDIEHFCEAVRIISKLYPLELCVSPGIMSIEQARLLKESGVGWVNHNLNTSARHYPKVCTTHSYDARVNTVDAVKRSGLKACSGGIIGMGETDDDIVDMLLSFRKLKVDAIPINFLNPIPGTPMEKFNFLDPMKCLKVLCLARLLNPESELRAAGGREVNLRMLQGLALYAINSIFIEGYLTTSGQSARDAYRMIEDFGFEVEKDVRPGRLRKQQCLTHKK
jgi:biotin synthase